MSSLGRICKQCAHKQSTTPSLEADDKFSTSINCDFSKNPLDFLSSSVTVTSEEPSRYSKKKRGESGLAADEDFILSKQDSFDNSGDSKKRGKRAAYKTKVEDRICTECSVVGTSKSRPWYKNKNSQGFLCNTCYSRITRREKRQSSK